MGTQSRRSASSLTSAARTRRSGYAPRRGMHSLQGMRRPQRKPVSNVVAVSNVAAAVGSLAMLKRLLAVAGALQSSGNHTTGFGTLGQRLLQPCCGCGWVTRAKGVRVLGRIQIPVPVPDAGGQGRPLLLFVRANTADS